MSAGPRDCPEHAREILDFWFADAREGDAALRERGPVWFTEDPEFDAECTRRFGATLDAALAGELDHWADHPYGRLALVILLDQLARNIHRRTARAYAGDARALALALEALDTPAETALAHTIERKFLHLPLEHAEDLAVQERSVAITEALVASVGPEIRDYYARGLVAVREHRDTVARFGRFPHRNAVLGRRSTPEELEHLGGDAPRWGQ